ncbi:MAG: zf-HC2 domain-containing protein, partial [Sciscionella sp.]
MRDPHRRCAQPRSCSDELAELSDRALLDRMRVGDDAAFGALYCRHADAVRAFAARTSAGSEGADDLTAEAFFRVLQTVRNGSGPVEYVRAYLITVTRRVAAEWSARRFDVPVSDEELVRRSEPGLDGAARRVERSLIATAFISLPERWRTVLWRVEVEGERPAVVAHYFGLSANATAALARRARDGLRAAYLQAHLSTSGGHGACRSITQKLGAYTAGGLRGSEMRRVDAHLAECPACRSLHAELSEVCSGLRVHAGLLLAPVAAAGLASAGTVSSGGAGTSLAAGAKIGKLAAFAARVKLGLTAASATAIGVLGVGAGLLPSDARPPLDQGLDGNHGNVIAVSPESTSSGPSSTRLSARGSPHQVSTPTPGEQQRDVSSQAHHGS